jgi:general secretion pathway protein E
MNRSHRLIGQILLERHFITADHLAEALQLPPEPFERIGACLVRLKHLTEEALAQGLAEQWQLPYLPAFDPEQVDISLSKKVPISFAKRRRMLPIQRIGDTVQVAAADPLDVVGLDDLALRLASPVSVTVSPPRALLHEIHRVYERSAEPEETIADLSNLSGTGLKTLAEEIGEPEDLLDTNDQAPIIRLVNSIFFHAAIQRASDIHIEPFEKELLVRYRVDGMLGNVLSAPKRLQAALTSRIKIMAGLDIAEKRLPQDGRIALRIGSREIDVRVSDIPVAGGERLVLRLLDKSNLRFGLGDLGFSPTRLATFSRLIGMAHGMVLITGPTGSGKTTTLYAALNQINSPEKNIITIEDPIEYQIKGVGQIQVNPKIDLTFAGGLRSILRQDPDVIMVGEIRDVETAQIAIHASLTGHLVFSTLHTNDAAGAITRLLDMGIEPFLVSSSLLAVVAQRLVRRICPACRAEYIPSAQEREKLGGEVARNAPHFWRGAGCAQCLNTGYLGRVALYEMLVLNDELRTLILTKVDAAHIRTAAVAKGMILLREDGEVQVAAGVTTLEEILRVTQDETGPTV